MLDRPRRPYPTTIAEADFFYPCPRDVQSAVVSEASDKVRGISELPVFPLPVVLFPGVPLPLHIFEPRYRQMLKDIRPANNLFCVAYFDPHIPEIHPTREHGHWTGTKSVAWNPDVLSKFDAVVISTAHKAVNFDELAQWANCIVDTRNAMAPVKVLPGKIWKA